MEDVLKPPWKLATDRYKAVILVYFLSNVFGVCVSCRILYFIVSYLYVSCSGSITSVGEERANLSDRLLLSICMWFLFRVVFSSSGCFGRAALFYCGTP